MQLTKTQETEILKAYGTYFDSYMKGDIETVASLLDDEYTQVGSAEGEVFFNKKDAVQFLYDTMDQVAGKVEMRNRVVKLERQENTFLIHEFADLYALAVNDWIFYSKFRASTFMQNKNGAWKIVHQHSSFPDARAEDGQNLAVDKVAEENRQLREAVKRRTIELEQKNRDLEIETSLEKVRAVAMGMKQPADMLDVCKEISDQFQQLSIKEIRNVQTAVIDELKGTYQNFEYYKLHDKSIITEVDYHHHEMTTAFVKQMLNGPEELFSQNLAGKELKDWFEHQKTTNQFVDNHLATAASLNYYWYSIGPVALGVSTYAPLNETEINLIKRFRNVFELAYRRFMDIEKAVEQAREAQIELALERVRARTMAMQKSDELKHIIQVVYDQLVQLNISIEHTGFIMDYRSGDEMNIWLADHHEVPSFITIPYFDSPHWNSFLEAKEKGKDFFINTLNMEEKDKFYQQLFNFIPGLPEAAKERYFRYPGLAISTVLLDNIGLYIENFSGIPFTDEENKTLMRFGKVFQQTYTRFLDLQKAEEQSREAQIELGLERVRARAMAMQKSSELAELVDTIFKELNKLHFLLNRCIIMIYDHNTNDSTWWLANPESGTAAVGVFVKYHEFPPYLAYVEAWNNRTLKWQYVLEGNTKREWDDFIFSETEMSLLPPPVIEGMKSVGRINLNASFNNFGSLTAACIEPMPEEQFDILLRFAKVFDLTYTRFNDLQKAEAQVREAQIELSLERVRAKTMAMHNSQDVADTTAIMFDEVSKLGIETFRCGIGIMHETKGMEVWTARPNEQGKAELVVGRLDMMAHPMLYGAYKTWLNKQEIYFYELKGDDLIAYYNVINSQADYPVKYDITKLPSRIMHSEFHFPEGCLFVFSLQDLSAEAIRIFKRFAGVFGQTYRRYLDLQKAEANATEAKIEASLERVRSKAMSMHSSQDLSDTIGVFYHELELFSITPRRCGVGLIDKETHVTELSTMSTTEDGRSIEIIGKIKLVGHPVLENIYSNWLLNIEYHPVLKGNEIKEYYQLLRPQIAFPDYPHDAVHYGYFFYFPEGGVYAWTDKVLAEDELKIYRRFTSVLSLTYKRYKDLKIAEAHARQSELDLVQLKEEKQRTEEALTELKATQSQLIQAEKMASLGELTAGIAHEIQNPLNFVNNFSEVSNELIVEMNEELLKGDIEEAKVIANDILQNLEKINHHGKRAAAIVKGMLQHSRASSATKEPTDINKLADEYLRLAYHGLKAKDKTFNATLKTDFDESIGNINIIPQDIGRVILNLITNAFYAVGEKKLQQQNDYEPTVSVMTKKLNDKIELSVKDNGSGISQKVLDKIFQPFFTTKPTGQGTGLGLSLAYDIVKTHGGALKVETKEGEGTEFIIQLPV